MDERVLHNGIKRDYVFLQSFEENEDVNKLDLFFKLSNLQLIQRPAHEMVKKTRCYLPQELKTSVY